MECAEDMRSDSLIDLIILGERQHHTIPSMYDIAVVILQLMYVAEFVREYTRTSVRTGF